MASTSTSPHITHHHSSHHITRSSQMKSQSQCYTKDSDPLYPPGSPAHAADPLCRYLPLSVKNIFDVTVSFSVPNVSEMTTKRKPETMSKATSWRHTFRPLQNPIPMSFLVCGVVSRKAIFSQIYWFLHMIMASCVFAHG
jgi:hypothetical protein